MPRKKKAKVCPALDIRHQERGNKIAIAAFRRGTDTPVGKMMLVDGPSLLSVSYAHVEPEMQHCGIGTKLYEHAVKVACDYQKPLASDDARTRYSEAFWQKQERKGRARCVREPDPDLDIGVQLDEEWRPTGFWDCGQYALNEACPSDPSLAGRRGSGLAGLRRDTEMRREIIRKVSWAMAHGYSFGEAVQTRDHGGRLTAAEQAWLEALEDRSIRAWRRLRNEIDKQAKADRWLIERTGDVGPNPLKGLPRPHRIPSPLRGLR